MDTEDDHAATSAPITDTEPDQAATSAPLPDTEADHEATSSLRMDTEPDHATSSAACEDKEVDQPTRSARSEDKEVDHLTFPSECTDIQVVQAPTSRELRGNGSQFAIPTDERADKPRGGATTSPETTKVMPRHSLVSGHQVAKPVYQRAQAAERSELLGRPAIAGALCTEVSSAARVSDLSGETVQEGSMFGPNEGAKDAGSCGWSTDIGEGDVPCAFAQYEPSAANRIFLRYGERVGGELLTVHRDAALLHELSPGGP